MARAYFNRAIIHYRMGTISLAIDDFRAVLGTSEDEELLEVASDFLGSLGVAP